MKIKSMATFGYIAAATLMLSTQSHASAVYTFSGIISDLGSYGANKQALLEKYGAVFQIGSVFQFDVLVDPDRTGYGVVNGTRYDNDADSYYTDLLSTNITLPAGPLTEAYQSHEAYAGINVIPSPGVWPKEQSLFSYLNAGDGISLSVYKETPYYCIDCSLNTQNLWPDYRLEYWKPGDFLRFGGVINDQLGNVIISVSNFNLVNVAGELPTPIPIPAAAWLYGFAICGISVSKLRKKI